MTPDYQSAAIKAAEILIKYGINSAPVDPLCILKKIPGTIVISYEKLSKDVGMDRRCVISLFGETNQDAFTSYNVKDGEPQYIVTYNQQLSATLFQRALARELGHIVLGHDGSRPEDVRMDEAICFAHHLLCPRPLIHAIQGTGLRLTVDMLGSMTGCYDSCLVCMRRMPAVDVPAELNRQIRNNFMPYIMNFFEYQKHASLHDGSALADLGSFMDGYKE